jgi:hypothetical protein
MADETLEVGFCGITTTPLFWSKARVMLAAHVPHNQKCETFRLAFLGAGSPLTAGVTDRTSNWKSLPSRRNRSGTEQAGFAHWETMDSFRVAAGGETP